MFAKNIPKRLLIYWLSIVTVHAVTSRSESNFGLPGEEFSGFRYPLEAYYRVQINPAFLPSVDRRGIYGGFNPEFESSYQTSAAIFLPARTTLGFTDNRNGSGSMALFVQNLNSGDIEARSPTKLELGTFSDSKMLISLMYGQKFTPYLSVGLGFKFINHIGRFQ